MGQRQEGDRVKGSLRVKFYLVIETREPTPDSVKNTRVLSAHLKSKRAYAVAGEHPGSWVEKYEATK